MQEIRQGATLEDRFLQKAGANSHATPRLDWLEEKAP
jgi:hypothetical protein